MKRESLHDGRADGLVSLESIDLGQIESFGDLLRSMSKTAFAGRQLGESFDILEIADQWQGATSRWVVKRS